MREARIADVPRLVALNESAQKMHVQRMPERFRDDAPYEEIASAFQDAIERHASCWLVAEEKGIVGFLSAEFRWRDETWCMVGHQSCYLGGIVVAAEYRQQGIGRRLVEVLRREAESREVDQIELDVWLFNDEARLAFESLGFEPIMQRMRLRPTRPNKRLDTNT